MSIQDQAVPGGAEHGAQLSEGEGVGVLADCGVTQADKKEGGGRIKSEENSLIEELQTVVEMQCKQWLSTWSQLSPEVQVDSILPI